MPSVVIEEVTKFHELIMFSHILKYDFTQLIPFLESAYLVSLFVLISLVSVFDPT